MKPTDTSVYKLWAAARESEAVHVCVWKGLCGRVGRGLGGARAGVMSGLDERSRDTSSL